MKRLLLLVAILTAFAFTAMAQDASSASGASGQSSTKSAKSSKKKSSESASADQAGGAAASSEKSSSAKSSTLTGCVSSSANSDGMYTLSNGRYKKGVEIGPTDKVKDHAGHQVQLKGKWSTAAAVGEANAKSAKEKGEHHFEVDSVKHISETCSTAPGGGTMGAGESKGAKKSKKSADSSATPKGF